MLVARLAKLKSPLLIEDAPALAPDDGSVVVTLQAAALNRRDYWITQGLYPGIQLPIVLGSDGAGTVSHIGSGVDASWIGQEVVIDPALAWGAAQSHQSHEFHILGMPTDGTFAEQVVVPASQLYPKPRHLDWQQAAALPLAGLTAYRALFTQGQLQKQHSALITGIGGGVATHALQFAATTASTVAVTSSSAAKLDRARALGATHTFNYRDSNWVADAKKVCSGFDVIIDGAGGSQYGQLMTLAKPGGCVVSYGSTAGSPESLDLFKLFWKQLRLVGCTMGSPRDFVSMLELVHQHQITPVIDETFSLHDANEALGRMARTEQFGKLVLAIR